MYLIEHYLIVLAICLFLGCTMMILEYTCITQIMLGFSIYPDKLCFHPHLFVRVFVCLFAGLLIADYSEANWGILMKFCGLMRKDNRRKVLNLVKDPDLILDLGFEESSLPIRQCLQTM